MPCMSPLCCRHHPLCVWGGLSLFLFFVGCDDDSVDDLEGYDDDQDHASYDGKEDVGDNFKDEGSRVIFVRSFCRSEFAVT